MLCTAVVCDLDVSTLLDTVTTTGRRAVVGGPDFLHLPQHRQEAVKHTTKTKTMKIKKIGWTYISTIVEKCCHLMSHAITISDRFSLR